MDPAGGRQLLPRRPRHQPGKRYSFLTGSNCLYAPPDYGDQPDPEAGKTNPAVLPAPPAGITSPLPPASGDVPAPAGEWQGSPGDWLTDLTAGSAPAAPELVAAADGCGIRLNIHDLSENEEGFTLYRQTTESPDWVHAADLASHSGKGWIEYQESNLTGGVTYYVSAFNSQGASSSNLVAGEHRPPGLSPFRPFKSKYPPCT